MYWNTVHITIPFSTFIRVLIYQDCCVSYRKYQSSGHGDTSFHLKSTTKEFTEIETETETETETAVNNMYGIITVLIMFTLQTNGLKKLKSLVNATKAPIAVSYSWIQFQVKLQTLLYPGDREGSGGGGVKPF